MTAADRIETVALLTRGTPDVAAIEAGADVAETAPLLRQLRARGTVRAIGWAVPDRVPGKQASTRC